MRIAVLTGLFASALIFSVGTDVTSAQASEVARVSTKKSETFESTPSVVALLSIDAETALHVLVDDEEKAPESTPAPVQEKKHVVTENETLIEIAKRYELNWTRIYDKNTTLENPDVLSVGLELIIPTAEEQLEERELPLTQVVEEAPVVTPESTQSPKKASPKPAAPAQVTRGASSGNGYVAGYCTWYVKNKRPDLPNNLGNAATWVSRAAAQGISTGATPVAGAVGQRGNHVVYVESVNDDGTVTISEMNHKGLYVITTRTLPANYFSYIY